MRSPPGISQGFVVARVGLFSAHLFHPPDDVLGSSPVGIVLRPERTGGPLDRQPRSFSRLMARRRASSAKVLRLRGPATSSSWRTSSSGRLMFTGTRRAGKGGGSSFRVVDAMRTAMRRFLRIRAATVSGQDCGRDSGRGTVLGFAHAAEGASACGAAHLRVVWGGSRSESPRGTATWARPAVDQPASAARRRRGEQEEMRMTRRPRWLAAAVIGGAIAIMAM